MIMKVISFSLLRAKLLECRICSIDEKINKLHELNLFFQSRFDMDRAEQIKKKIEDLYNRRVELMTAFQ